jgi:NAD(P)-dependent dehydrogenase (short-subunit alcohol dehydrogenase family)
MPERSDAPRDLFDVRDRTAVVTSGSGHLGLAMASALVQAGARVALHDNAGHHSA